MHYRVLALVLALVAGVMLAAPAVAKTSIAETDVPSDTTAGEPFEVGFTMVDHDGALGDDAGFTVVARKAGTAEELTFPASATDDPLSFAATLTLPDDGNWALRVVEERLGFQQDLASISVAANPALPVTQADLDSALEGATIELDNRVEGMEKHVLGLETKVEGLINERDALRQQVTALQREQSVASDRPTWAVPLVAGLLGAAAGALGAAATLRRYGTRLAAARQPAPAR